MNKLDRIVEEELIGLGNPKAEKIVRKALRKGEAIFIDIEHCKTIAQAVAKASFDETNHFVEKLLDGVEDLIERYVDDARWRSWVKKQRRKWQDLKKRWCGSG